ncbi:exo-alpha-sialidase [Sphingobacterium phlebotomi]|nr:exo-alpha-sialidase [Sphingobacterium phlebotomi]
MNILMLAVVSMLFDGCGKKDSPDDFPNDTVKIHTIHELNQEEEELDSHAGEEGSSVLELDFSSYTEISSAILGITNPVYSRIKKKKTGGYLLLYHNGQIGSNIYYSNSTDLKTWSNGELLFQQVPITSSQGADSRRYSTADAVVLSNGDILVAVSFRANLAYRHSPETNGIMMRRSKDNGFTWGEEQVIYTGTNWEPYLLELPSGEIQCYFTDTDPVYGNSGTSMVISNDGGLTWSPTGVSNNYKVIRQYKYMNQGRRIYTDQMPSVKLLNDGETLAGFMEARLEDNNQSSGNSYFMMSLVYGKDNWEHLTGDDVGPTDRQTNLFRGAGGYISQFRSGETVISCNINNIFSMKIGDNKARNFNHTAWNADWFQPFNGTGYWGSTEIDDAHHIIGTMHKSGTIMVGRFFLNHRINAPTSNIVVDGDTNDWTHTDALFIGSESQTQAVFRAAIDADNLYLLVERQDNYVATGDNVDLYIHNDEGNSLNINSLKITLDPAGVVACSKWSGSSWEAEDISLVTVSNKISGIINDGRADTGYLSEIGIPLSTINGNSGYVRFNAVLTDGNITDTFTFADPAKPESWMRIKKGISP